MARKESSTQEAILMATIDCINRYGIEQVTTRMIAEAADANIASINYYFRTKDQLMDQALKITITHMLEDVLVAIEDEEKPFRRTLHEIFYYLIAGTQANPGISTAHLYSLIVEKDYQSITGQSFLAVFEKLVDRAEEALPEADPGSLSIILASIFSAIMFMMLTPGFFPIPQQYDLAEEEGLQALAAYFTEMFFTMLEARSS